ncbi:MAG: hypothetical protein ACTSWW_05940 [Promethearchaeota archaeon]
MVKNLEARCPICKNNFVLNIDESIIENASRFPVVFSTSHCSKALICYIDANYAIRMIEIGHLAQPDPSTAPTDTSSESETEIMNVDNLSSEHRTILQCTINKSQFAEMKFPNLVEKQIFFQILKHGNLTMEKLIEVLKVIQNALNMEISHQTLSPIIEKYIKAGSLKRSVI